MNKIASQALTTFVSTMTVAVSFAGFRAAQQGHISWWLLAGFVTWGLATGFSAFCAGWDARR